MIYRIGFCHTKSNVHEQNHILSNKMRNFVVRNGFLANFTDGTPLRFANREYIRLCPFLQDGQARQEKPS